jgi:D-3-phosphoglycerate dehydrogenase / 2-oxoglutarate reductase
MEREKQLFNVINALEHFEREARAYLERNDCRLVDIYLKTMPEEKRCTAVRGIDAAIAGGEEWTEKVFQAADRLKIVARSGTGYDKVDLPGATRRKVWVTNTPGGPGPAVADFAVGLMLSLLRHIPMMAQALRGGNWEPLGGIELGSVTVGVIGLGNVGREIVRRVRGGFGSKVLGYDVFADESFAQQEQVRYVPLNELLAESGMVVLAVPLNEETKNLIDRQKLRMMKKDAYLINVARPGIVVKADLVECLRAQQIAGAAVDVHDPAPAMPGDPLIQLPNVLATPWAAFYTREAVHRMNMEAARQVVTVLKGGKPTFPVNRLDGSK